MEDPAAITEQTSERAGDPAPEQRTQPAAHAALIAVQLLFSTLPIAAKYYVLPFMPAAGLVLMRVTGAALVLFVLARGRSRRATPDRRDLARLALYAMLGVAVNQLFFIEGLSRTTAVNAQVICTTIPAFTLMFGALVGVDRISPYRLGGILLAAAGAIYLVGPDRIEVTPQTTLGNAMIATNALAYSLYLVLSKPILKRYDSITVISWVFLFGAIFVAPFGATALAETGALSTMPVSAWVAVAFIILLPTVGSYWLNAWALHRSAPSVVAAYIYLQPLITGVLAIVVIRGEHLDPRALPSSALIFAGVFLTTRR